MGESESHGLTPGQVLWLTLLSELRFFKSIPYKAAWKVLDKLVRSDPQFFSSASSEVYGGLRGVSDA